MIGFLVVLLLLCFHSIKGKIDDSYLVGNARCSNFNAGLRDSKFWGARRPFVCPEDDGIAGNYCKESFPVRSPRNTTTSNVRLQDLIFYILIGPKSTADPLLWWLQLVYEEIDFVLVADACSDGKFECSDSATVLVEKIRQQFKLVNVHLYRSLQSDSGYSILSCKLRTGQKLIYDAFPDKKYFIKLDTDTIFFPQRLLHFIQTLDIIARHGHNSPLYFGTMVESGIPQLLCKHSAYGTTWKFENPNESMCYCQGGAGYGVSNPVMRHLASVKSCDTLSTKPSDLPEDLYLALEVYHNFNNTVAIHCGSFRSSELVGEEWFKHSISFHYIDSRWLKSHGQKLIDHYQQQHPPTNRN